MLSSSVEPKLRHLLRGVLGLGHSTYQALFNSSLSSLQTLCLLNSSFSSAIIPSFTTVNVQNLALSQYLSNPNLQINNGRCQAHRKNPNASSSSPKHYHQLFSPPFVSTLDLLTDFFVQVVCKSKDDVEPYVSTHSSPPPTSLTVKIPEQRSWLRIKEERLPTRTPSSQVLSQLSIHCIPQDTN